MFDVVQHCEIFVIKMVYLFKELEFQGPYVPLRNSSPCGGLARFARKHSSFARKLLRDKLIYERFNLPEHYVYAENFVFAILHLKISSLSLKC